MCDNVVQRLKDESFQYTFTVPQAAQVSGLRPKNLYRQIKSGKLKAVRPAGHLMIARGELLRFLCITEADIYQESATLSKETQQ